MSLLLIPASKLLGAGCFLAWGWLCGKFEAFRKVLKKVCQTQEMKYQPIQIR